jgi:3-oxoacyl-[acyl-carrier protein] reductase
MDLEIKGRRAIICASSRGLGRACAEALAREGVDVVISGRRAADVEKTVSAINALGGGLASGVVGDVTSPEGRKALLQACPAPDILINNSAGPAPKFFADIDSDDWPAAVEQNMISPLLLTKAVLPSMRKQRFGRIINITSAMVTTPRPHMALSSAPRAGLTAAMKALSIEVARDNVTINNLLPERIDTERQQFMAEATAKRESITYEEARAKQIESIAARRLGEPREFGAACAFLCSALAGFISGQNLHLDGGSYPALL